MSIDPRAGTLESPDEKLDVAALRKAYRDRKPDPAVAAQRVSFGTSGHRGSPFDTAFNEDHILAITEAICRHRQAAGIDGPLFLGRDSHAVSEPAFHTALEVLAGHGVTVMVDRNGDVTPTPVVSHAIITHNRGRDSGLADGILITPSHNPPEDGGFKYNPPHGGPAEAKITSGIERAANALLEQKLAGVRRASPRTTPHDYVGSYVNDLGAIIDMAAIARAGLRIHVDPLGGAAVHYWAPVAERYGLNLSADTELDPTFAFVPRDWDGKIRMDCSSPYPMRRVLARKDEFDILFANDTDADRHGIVTAAGLMPPNDYLATMAWYLATTRPAFGGKTIGKTVVSSSNIDRVAKKVGMGLYQVPVGFKWFVDGLSDARLYFCGEESAGASFLRRDGTTWTTDKDGLIAGLLACEMLATTGKSPDKLFGALREEFGSSFYARIDNPADAAFRTKLAKVTPDQVKETSLGGDPITAKFTDAPGNKAAIGGIKLETKRGWIAARPSGTEDIYKVYAESFAGVDHLTALQDGAKALLKDL
jgi:phosphoglucomutase